MYMYYTWTLLVCSLCLVFVGWGFFRSHSIYRCLITDVMFISSLPVLASSMFLLSSSVCFPVLWSSHSLLGVFRVCDIVWLINADVHALHMCVWCSSHFYLVHIIRSYPCPLYLFLRFASFAHSCIICNLLRSPTSCPMQFIQWR